MKFVFRDLLTATQHFHLLACTYISVIKGFTSAFDFLDLSQAFFVFSELLSSIAGLVLKNSERQCDSRLEVGILVTVYKNPAWVLH